MSILSSITGVIHPPPVPTPPPVVRTQYSAPIGPTQPYAFDTQGNPVFGAVGGTETTTTTGTTAKDWFPPNPPVGGGGGSGIPHHTTTTIPGWGAPPSSIPTSTYTGYIAPINQAALTAGKVYSGGGMYSTPPIQGFAPPINQASQLAPTYVVTQNLPAVYQPPNVIPIFKTDFSDKQSLINNEGGLSEFLFVTPEQQRNIRGEFTTITPEFIQQEQVNAPKGTTMTVQDVLNTLPTGRYVVSLASTGINEVTNIAVKAGITPTLSNIEKSIGRVGKEISFLGTQANKIYQSPLVGVGIPGTPVFVTAKEIASPPISYNLKDVMYNQNQNVVSRGLEIAKFGLYKPFNLLGTGLIQTGDYIQNKIPNYVVGGLAAAPFQIAGELSPDTPLKMGTFIGVGSAFKYIPKITKTVFAIEGVKGLAEAETPKEYVESGLMFGIGAGGSILKAGRTLKAITSSEKAVQFPFESAPGTPLRNRATVILKSNDWFGNPRILYSIDKPTGTYMLPGGNIKSGETSRAGAIRELREETGLGKKDINLNFKEIIKTGEHKHYVYEANVDRNIIKSLSAQGKEIGGFKWITPMEYSGATMLNPFGRKVSFAKQPISYLWNDRIIRSEDLFVGSKNVNPGLQQTRLLIQQPGEVFLRNDKPIYLKKRVDSSDFFLNMRGYKPGQFKKFQKTPGILVGFGSRYNIPFSKLKPYFGKTLYYIHGSPGKIKTENVFSSSVTGGFKGIENKDVIKVKSEFFKRGEKVLFFQPPTTANPLTSQSYVGGTYLGLYRKARPDSEMGVKLRFGQPTIYRYPAKLGDDLIATQKAQRGTEFEAGKKPIVNAEDYSFVVGGESKTYLAGRKVSIIELESKPTIEISKAERQRVEKIMEKGKTFEEYSSGKRPYTYGEAIGSLKYEYEYIPKKSKIESQKYSDKYKEQKYFDKYTYEGKYDTEYPSTKYKYKGETYKSDGTYSGGTYKGSETYGGGTYKGGTYRGGGGTYRGGGGTYISPPYKSKSEESKIGGKGGGPQDSFFVLSFKNKKPYLITPKPLSKEQALGFGAKYVRGTERATFKLIPSKQAPTKIDIKGLTETEVYQMGFRGPVKKGKVLSTQNIFIQKKPTRMGTLKETKAIQSYKRGKSLW